MNVEINFGLSEKAKKRFKRFLKGAGWTATFCFGGAIWASIFGFLLSNHMGLELIAYIIVTLSVLFGALYAWDE